MNSCGCISALLVKPSVRVVLILLISLVEFLKGRSCFINLVIEISVVHTDVYIASQGMKSFSSGNARRLMQMEKESVL